MKRIIFYLSVGLIANSIKAQTTHQGINANWYQIPRAAAMITGTTPSMDEVAGAVVNNIPVKQSDTVIIDKQSTQNKWVQSFDGHNTWSFIPNDIRIGDTTVNYVNPEVSPFGNYMIWIEIDTTNGVFGRVWQCGIDSNTGDLIPPNGKGYSPFFLISMPGLPTGGSTA